MTPPLVLGPIPPPTDGRAVATAWLIQALLQRGLTAEVIDTQLPRGRLRSARKAVRCLGAAARLISGRRRSFLLVASAGTGLLLELLPLMAARTRGGTIYMVHHSSMYVRRRWLPMTLAIRLGGRKLRHVFLCTRMRADFNRQYGGTGDDFIILDNALLIPSFHDASVTRDRSIVHIGSLSRAKGTVTALQIAERLGAPLRLGGPAEREVMQVISDTANRTEVAYLGFVDNDAKRTELSRGRVFLFPSTYENEAQPLVVYEAASAGAIPIVWDIGWVRDQMARLGLSRFVIPRGDVEGLLRATEEILTMSQRDFHDLSRSTMRRFWSHKECSASSVDDLVVALAG